MIEVKRVEPVSVKDLEFKEGILTFKILENDEWVDAKVETGKGHPVQFRADGNELVIEKLVDYTKNEETGECTGGYYKQITRFKISAK